MRFADLDELEAGQADLESVRRAWCDGKADWPRRARRAQARAVSPWSAGGECGSAPRTTHSPVVAIRWNPFRREERAAVDLADGAAAGLDDGVGPDDLQVQQQSGTTGYRTQAAA